MEDNLFRYAWRHSRRQQLWLICAVLVSLPFYYFSLDLPKAIINGPIQGTGFTAPGATHTAMQIGLQLPDWLGGASFQFFPGVQLDRVGTLVYLCMLFLALVLINGAFKLQISTYKGLLGERLLRRLRYQLVDMVLRFPLAQFRRLRSSEVATIVKDEVEPLGGFFGDAFVQPLLLVSQAATAMAFILLQSVTLGLVAAAIVAVQLLIIPRLRRKLLVLGRQRQLTARLLAGRIAEIVEGIAEVRTNDTSNWERAEIASRLGRIFFIRMDIYQWKFLVKFINNLLAQVTPFIFYLVGGYLAIVGQVDIGQLVAVIAAYKDLPTPLKELIDWDQARLDAQLRYTQVLDQFSSASLLDPELQALAPADSAPTVHELSAHEVSIRDDAGMTVLEPVSLSLTAGTATLATGAAGCGAEYLAEACARLVEPASGRVLVDGAPIQSLPDSFLARSIGYAGAQPYFGRGTLRHALLYGLYHAPDSPPDGRDATRQRNRHEARLSGNTEHDVEDDWINYTATGTSGPDDLTDRLRRVITAVELEGDIYRIGLGGRFPEAFPPEIEARLVAARDDFRAQLGADGTQRFVEPFEAERYTANATVLENLVFGLRAPDAQAVPMERDPYLDEQLEKIGLRVRLIDMGRQIATTLIELFGDLQPGNPLLERMDIISPDELPQYQALLPRFGKPGEAVPPDVAAALLKLAYAYIEPRHHLGLLDKTLEQEILAARQKFREGLPPSLTEVVFFHEPGRLNPAASIQDNILFGRIAVNVAEAPERVSAILRQTLDELGLTTAVVERGLAFEIGSGGKGLSLAQRQKISLARATLKRPDVLILNRALDALETVSQSAIIGRVMDAATRRDGQKPAVLCVVSSFEPEDRFDRVLAFSEGRLIETRERGQPARPGAEPTKEERAQARAGAA